MHSIELKYNEGVYTYDNRQWHHSSFNAKYIEQILNYKPKVIFEFGSFDGGDGLRYKLEYPDCQVYSFEPLINLYNTVRLVEQYGVKTFNFGFFNKIGVFPIYVSKLIANSSDCGASSLLQVTENTKKNNKHLKYEDIPQYINTTTIESFCNKYIINEIDFMQIDVEGVSQEVIEGFGNIRPKIIFIELQSTDGTHMGSSKTENVINILKLMGYEFITTNNVDSLFVRTDIIRS